MKKTLALALALVLCLGLCTPALATKDPVEGYVDPVEQYALDHPEEIAALDVDALLADWGFKDMTAGEAFLAWYGSEGSDLADAVKMYYINQRLIVKEYCSVAAKYKAEYPEEWESFDADAVFQKTMVEENGWANKEEYVRRYCILTEEEFVDRMFQVYIYDSFYDYDYDSEWSGDDFAEPSLKLVVNGVASDVAIAANDWTTYADAAALRAILGETAVAPGYEGPVPIREAAENAGWDVQWYDGGWADEDQEVQLWNKDLILQELEPQVEPFQQVVDAVAGLARRTLWTETPQRQTQTVTLTFKKFDTLDGDKTYTMKGRAEAVYQGGVVDMTMTLDLSALVELLPADTVKYMALSLELTVDELKGQLSALKIEAIADYNQGATAVRMPLLETLGLGQGDWQISYSTTPEWLEGPNYAESLYDDMVRRGEWAGGVSARTNMEEQVAAEGLVLEDSLKKVGSTITWTIKTDKLNKGLLSTDDISYFDETPPFKKFDLTLSISGDESYDLTLAIRPNADCPAMLDQGDLPGMFLTTGDDFDLSLTAHGDSRQATVSGKLHVKNFGVFDLASQSTTGSAGQGPRQIKDVERLWVEPAPDAVLTQAK